MIKEAVIKAVVGVVITAAWGFFIGVMRNMYKKQKAVEEGLQALLRAEIIRTYEKTLDKGYCAIYSKDAIEKCYSSYKNLGGNGVVDNLHTAIAAANTAPAKK